MRALLVLVLVFAAGPAAAADGREAYANDCAGCHSLTGASTPAGPSLKGLMWRKIASLPDFAYSNALRATVGTWTPARLDAFLKNTQAFAPGSDMLYDVPDAAERRAIVGYLQSLN